MQRRTIPGKRSLKKKKPIRFQKFINLTFLVTTIVVFIFMLSALVDNISVYQKIIKNKGELGEDTKMALRLQKELEYTKTTDFIEHYARENLDMLKSGEFIIILKGN